MPKKKTVTKKTAAKKAPAKKAPKKASKVVAPTPAPAPAPVAVAAAPPPKTEADQMWDEIKNRPIEMFALPDQVVAQHCTPVPVDPTKLYLVLRSTAVLPSLEASTHKDFELTMADKWCIVTRKAPALPKK